MKNVARILSRKGSKVIAVDPDCHVLDALKMMADKNIGSMVVLKKNQYCGMMTERDYARKVILKGKHSADITVADIMSTDLPHITPADTIEKCMALMTEKNIRYLPVFEKDELCGMISINDLVKETILDQKHTIEQLHNYIQS